MLAPRRNPGWQEVLLAAGIWISGLGMASAQTLEVMPTQVLADEAAVIRATGLQPNEHISIRAELVDGVGMSWASQAEFVADAQGMIDVSRQAPVKGSYSEVSAMGLIWSMRPVEKHVSSYQSPPDLGAQAIKLALARNGQQVASAQLEQLSVAGGVQRINLEGKIHGVLFLPNTQDRRPGVLVLGGSEGGMPTRKAAWLASRGYVALALAYFRYDGLPDQLEEIPLEYFGTALAWMIGRPEVLADQIAVVGTSRGGELALQLGSMYPQIKAVVAYVPANVRYPGCCGDFRVPAWTWQGQPLAFVNPRLAPGDSRSMPAAIAVERTHGPVLLISGGEDGVWDSTLMASAVIDRLKRAHFPYPCEHLKYPHAGHRAGRPEIVPAWHGAIMNPTSGREVNPGGNAPGDAESSLDAIPKVLEFLRTSLAEPSSPK